MPKRLLDDSLLTSPSIAACSPRAQDAFPRFLLLADDFGCMEAAPRVLLGKGWPYRTDVTEADLAAWLAEYEAIGMAQLWEEGGRRWCFLTGWTGPHGQRPRSEYGPKNPKGSKRRTPAPPVSRSVPAAEAHAHPAAEQNVSDSVPGREIPGKLESPANLPPVSRSVPAYAVPVAVAVPVARDTLSSRAREGELPAQVVPLVAKAQTPAERYPLTAALIAELDRLGWPDAAFSRDEPTRKSIEAAIRLHGVPAAASRVLARVDEDRTLKLVPRPWLGFYIDDITDRRKAVPVAASVGVAAPSPASAFTGGERDFS